jgi:hypothetical protein
VFGMNVPARGSRNFPDDRQISSFQHNQAHACHGFLGP